MDKRNIKKTLMVIPYFLLYILYVLITMDKRNEYMVSERKGIKCIGSKDTSMFIYGSETTYYFNPNEKPSRDYITWREFWEQKGYIKIKK